ncbi:hypothetical protein ER308_19325 [Egibacter rhizosphaerae]|uniref:PH domain-containing protein n=1 Tax=Egibacter rhizosphaerae TaxID=1670831 RepID=A0A411YJX7_9ACTN|nr:hypothetical protein [Egibacter rhizosphaerae]QBI21508.1 hypothetical protein ER308_19325 [Egibacter rhizosphaerae]
MVDASERRWRAHPLVRLQRWLWLALVVPLCLVAVWALLDAQMPTEALGPVAVATVFLAVAVLMWRVSRTEVRLGPTSVVIRRVRPRRIVPLASLVGVRGDERLAHVVVLDTDDGPVDLPRSVTSFGSLGADERSREIHEAIAARAEVSR